MVHSLRDIGDDDFARARITGEGEVTAIGSLDGILKLDVALGTFDVELVDVAALFKVGVDVLFDIVWERDGPWNRKIKIKKFFSVLKKYDDEKANKVPTKNDGAPRVIVECMVETGILGIEHITLNERRKGLRSPGFTVYCTLSLGVLSKKFG